MGTKQVSTGKGQISACAPEETSDNGSKLQSLGAEERQRNESGVNLALSVPALGRTQKAGKVPRQPGVTGQ